MKLAVVLFNLGAPARAADVQPFLYNLFNDPAIIGLPSLPRRLLASFIARRRARVAKAIYDTLGGGSPLLANTLQQAAALQAALSDLGEVQVVPAMRYWHPMSDEAVARVKDFAPERIVLLPLYPQYSTTTTGSSFKAWTDNAKRLGLDAPGHLVCCYPTEPGFIRAIATLTRPVYEKTRATHPAKPTRLLFTAHGLPKRVIAKGDPYQIQIEMTAAAVVEALNISDLDWQLSYQSRVGPLEWIGPYTEHELARAGADRVPLVVVPIAFVSEHSETLVELDITYREEARGKGVPVYERVPTVGICPDFVAGLARLVREAVETKADVMPYTSQSVCSAVPGRCAPTPARV
jgi:ferrochelatase